ncbi:MAG: hypothetical protein VYE73_01755 [Acidobacteriota bacterium]|nr:hypothetical protein [Acidobacteriota bacterium]
MTYRKTVVASALLIVALIVPAAFAAGAWTVPRTADGQPDISGVWDFRTLTPLQRPGDVESAVLSEDAAADAEKASIERAAREDAPSDLERETLPVGGNVGGYNSFWMDRGARVVEDRRTSLIVDPPDGRIPPRVEGAQEQIPGDDKPSDRPVRIRAAGIGRNGPEDRGVSERCLLGFNTGPPITPGGYNQNVQIFQVPGTVALLTEMVHDSRIIPLDGRPHVADDIRQWKGDSRGYWDGDTLVVETTNFTHKIASFSPHPFASYGSAEKMHLTERFTRVDDDTLHYEFTVNDPRTFTQPFTAILQMQKADHALYEYACHEGNYGLHNVLAGARQEEQEAAASQQAQH